MGDKYMSWEEFGKLATADLAYDDDACSRISESLYDREVKIGTVCQLAEQITTIKAEFADRNNVYFEAMRKNKDLIEENQRLKECAEMGLEANAEKAEQIATIDNIVNRNDGTTPLSKLIEIAAVLKGE